MAVPENKTIESETNATKDPLDPSKIVIFILFAIVHIVGLYILTNVHMRAATILSALAPIVSGAIFGIRGSISIWVIFTIIINPLIFTNSYLGFSMSYSPVYIVGSIMTLGVVIIIGRLHDLEKRVRQLNAKLYILSRTDELTQLLNRRATIELANREIKRSERERGNLAYFTATSSDKKYIREAEAAFKAGRSIDEYFGVIAFAILDLDFFKNVNDNYGHAAGDKVLADFALFMKESFRDTDIIGRYGGEEFLVVFPGTTASSATIALRHLADRLRLNKIYLPDKSQIQVTFSAGIAEQKDSTETLDRILERADNALYTAKKEGRDQVIIAKD